MNTLIRVRIFALNRVRVIPLIAEENLFDVGMAFILVLKENQVDIL